MRTHQLRVNFVNLKAEIDKDYFKYKDIFYRCMMSVLCIHHLTRKQVLQNTMLEDSGYHQILSFLQSKGASLEEIVSEIKDLNQWSYFLDMHVYLEEFIDLRHNDLRLNLYDLTIDDSYHVVITNKHLNAYAL